MGVYQGADTMESKRAQSLWDVGQGKKRHDKQTLDQLGKRQLFGAVSDIGETFLIGTGSAYIGDKDRKDFGSGADVAEAGGLFSSEGLGTLLGFMKNGGRVPKYKEGGGLFKRFGKKKQPEKDEALVA